MGDFHSEGKIVSFILEIRDDLEEIEGNFDHEVEVDEDQEIENVVNCVYFCSLVVFIEHCCFSSIKLPKVILRSAR